MRKPRPTLEKGSPQPFEPETKREYAMHIAQAFHRHYGEVVMAIVYYGSLARGTDAPIHRNALRGGRFRG